MYLVHIGGCPAVQIYLNENYRNVYKNIIINTNSLSNTSASKIITLPSEFAVVR